MSIDSSNDPEEGLDLDEEEDYAMRVMTSKPHLIKANPLLKNFQRARVHT